MYDSTVIAIVCGGGGVQGYIRCQLGGFQSLEHRLLLTLVEFVQWYGD